MREHLRFSLAPIVRRHLWSLRAPGRKHPSPSVWLVLYAVPVAVGVLAWWLYAPIDPNGSVVPNPLVPLMAALGALLGGFIAAFVLLMNLRLKLHETPDLPASGHQKTLIGETATTSLYLAILTGSLLILCIASSIAWTQIAFSAAMVLRILLGILAAVATHIIITAGTVIRRVYAAYFGLFGSDLGAKLRAVRDEERHIG